MAQLQTRRDSTTSATESTDRLPSGWVLAHFDNQKLGTNLPHAIAVREVETCPYTGHLIHTESSDRPIRLFPREIGDNVLVGDVIVASRLVGPGIGGIYTLDIEIPLIEREDVDIAANVEQFDRLMARRSRLWAAALRATHGNDDDDDAESVASSTTMIDDEQETEAAHLLNAVEDASSSDSSEASSATLPSRSPPPTDLSKKRTRSRHDADELWVHRGGKKMKY